MFSCWEFEGDDDDDVGDGVCEEMQRECNAVAAGAVGMVDGENREMGSVS